MKKASKYGVLFVDDQFETRSAYQLYFQRCLNFLTAKNHIEASKTLKEKYDFEIAVILVDLQLSDMQGDTSGLNLLTECAHVYPSITRILITGYINGNICLEAINSGTVHKMIAKPCLLKNLEQLLYEAMGQFIKNKMGRLS
jgi:two-component system, sensor histidine kinase and response regulator